MNKILVVGASGATGRLLVQALLDRGLTVIAIVRSPQKLPESLRTHHNLQIVQASPLNLSEVEMAQYTGRCSAVASCLGHNLSWRGIYGQPRKLVTDALRQICGAIKLNLPETPTKVVLMNTAGNSNRDLHERVSFAQKCVIWLIRTLLPPHADNEQAADYLRVKIGQNHPSIEWSVVRPDNLTDEAQVSQYEVHPSPIRSAIFDAGSTSRINVGDFMANLITDDSLWNQWEGQMPVIYNKDKQL
ncbi:NAD(P)-dependent oxidoreductase [cf. Phormidesmis sp. LEGE 11477]|uniref:NAD(P)-dependent oxidoreductase n=1 Tax=cf. Phormidesmis sp. LEGE 11477 TaxID=1828680 RepID=UPI001881ECBF|nr:NAD(P)-binding oxidoreductase [cf. Phormidesmis sp. LEGE 11477]MBE9063047.1 NAD(P)H-binding protein [cf. Phormidesmis sp. LEGE 11477]